MTNKSIVPTPFIYTKIDGKILSFEHFYNNVDIIMVTGPECSSIRPPMIRVITKSDDRVAGVRFVITSVITDPSGRSNYKLTMTITIS